MNYLRVLIVNNGQVVDVHELEDPRIRYIADFNQLNNATPYLAVLDDGSGRPQTGWSSRTRPPAACRAERHCRRPR